MRYRYPPAGYARNPHYPGLHRGDAPGLGQVDQAGAAPPLTAGVTPEVIAEDFFVYNTQFEDLASGASASNFIQIEADSDFLVQKFTYASFVLDNSTIEWQEQDIPLVTIVIIDTGSGRQLMNNPVPLTALFGDGRLPFILPTPKLFVKNSRIQVNLFNFNTSDAYGDIWINFLGKKIFTAS